MTANENFLQAIHARPDDTDLRLVYADWLEEHGDPRGELVRLDVALAQAGHERQREAEMAWRRRELQRALAGAVLPPPLGSAPLLVPDEEDSPPDRPRVQIACPVETAAGWERRELPFVVGVLADLSGHRTDRAPLAQRPFLSIDRHRFDAVLARIGPQLRLSVPAGEGEPLRLELTFRALADFGPARLTDAVPELRRLRDDRGRLSALLAALLHHPDFQRLEATWRGLHYLVGRTETGERLKIRVLDVSKRDLLRDFEQAPLPQKAALFARVCTEEFGYAEAEPFGLLVGDYEFSHDPEDVALLRALGRVAGTAQAPFVAAAAPQLFGLDRFTDLVAWRDPERWFQGIEWLPWRSFRESEESRYIALTLPRVLSRRPYGTSDQSAEGLAFQELDSGESADKFLWMSAAWAYAACVTKAFARDGWLARTRGVEDGKVEGLPVHPFPTDDGEMAMNCPTEVALSDRREHELSNLGFLPLLRSRPSNCAAFLGARSCHRPQRFTDRDARARAELATQFNVLLCASRFVQAVSVMARDWLGARRSLEIDAIDECQRWLNDWIAEYVATTPFPVDVDERDLFRRPLSTASVTVRPVRGQTGRYTLALRLCPRLHLASLDVSLQFLVGIPRPALWAPRSRRRRETEGWQPESEIE